MEEIERLRIANTCYAIVCGRFADMLNPKMRGDNFSWLKFPEMMGETCKTEIFLYFDSHEWSYKQLETYKDTAKDFGIEIADNFINRALPGLDNFQ